MSSEFTRIALFIDGPNLHATARTLGFEIDYKCLLSEFQSRGKLVRAFYYTAIIEDQEFSAIRPLVDWLDYNGYTVVTKASKEFADASGRGQQNGRERSMLVLFGWNDCMGNRLAIFNAAFSSVSNAIF